MKVAIVGSRCISNIDISQYLSDCDEIVSGGAKGVDTLAEKYAIEQKIPYKVFLPQYELYGRGAPIVRNQEIVDYSDKVIAFWDGRSKGTLSVIKYAKKKGKICQVIFCEQ